MTPCDFFLFPRLKRIVKGRRFATIDEIKTESLKELKSEFQKCFQD
jgi:[histone H3]-lysine36 N-dimethyltransferase SETMAR